MNIIVTIYNTATSGRSPFIRQFKATERGRLAAIQEMMAYRCDRIATTHHMTMMDAGGLHAFDGNGDYLFTIPPELCIRLNLAHWKKCIEVKAQPDRPSISPG